MSTYARFETDTAASACWHCADPCGAGRVVQVPLVDGTITGCFCSFSCAKRWCIDTRHTEAIVNLVISNGGRSVAAAPPRHCLKRFGGAFEPRSDVFVQSMPPLSTPLKLTAAVQDVPTGGRQDSLFREFVKQRRYVNADGTEEADARPPVHRSAAKKKKKPSRAKRPRQRPAPKKVASGTLAAFIVPVDAAAASDKTP